MFPVSIGVALPTNRRRYTGSELTALVERLEAAGCTTLWVNDHLAAFADGDDVYPYSAAGTADWSPQDPQYEAIVTCGYLAACTSSARIGTSVLVLPQRNPVEVAKSTATLAEFTGGRFVLGVGAGWARREMRTLGWDPATRGARLDEQITLIRDLWIHGRPTAAYTHYPMPLELVMEPRPRKEHIPAILVGGTSAAALARAARLGDGWIAVSGCSQDGMLAAGRSLEQLRKNTSRRVTGVLKIAADHPDQVESEGILSDFAGHSWDEVCFEFRAWDTKAVCGLVKRLVAKSGCDR